MLKAFYKIRSRIPLTLILAVCALALGALFHHPAGGMIVGGFAGMIIDAQCVLSDAQALVATGVSTNVFDTVLATNDIGTGEPMCVEITVDVAADLASGDETYQFQLIQSANNDLSAPDVISETTVAYITKAKLVKGFRLYIPIPPELKTKRYIGMNYVLGGTTPSITLTASIIPLKFAQVDKYYPKNFTITS